MNKKKAMSILLLSALFITSDYVYAEGKSETIPEIKTSQTTNSAELSNEKSEQVNSSLSDEKGTNSQHSFTNVTEENVKNEGDPYFPKRPSQQDIDGDKVKPGDLSNQAVRRFSLFSLRASTGQEINNTIYQKLASGEYSRAQIQKNWREYALFPYKSKEDINKEVRSPSGIVVHETANPNSTIWSEINYMDQNWENAFVHAFVDKGNIVEVHDPSYGAWGAGRIANRYFIHVELVEHVRNLDDFRRSILNDAYYMAVKLRQFGLTPSRPTGIKNDLTGTIWSHKEVSYNLGGTNHVDPDDYFATFGYTMADYYDLVSKEYNTLAPIETTTTVSENQKNGTASIDIRTNDDSSLEKMMVPVWSKMDQSDINWYEAKKVRANHYRVDVSFAKHQFVTGKYNAHLYVHEKSGRVTSKDIGPINLQAPDLKVKTRIESNQKNGTANIAIEVNDDSELQKIQVPVWSKKDQSDLKWYDAEKVGTNQYRVLVDFMNHQFNKGEYMVHLYTYEKSGRIKSENIGPMNLQGYFLTTKTKIESNQKNGTANIAIEVNDDSELQKIQVPVWSKKDQSDLKWYDAEKVGTNQYRVLVDYANHQFNQGDYIAHLYTYEKSGKVTSVNLGTMQLTSAPLKVETTKAVNEKNGTAVITLKTNDDYQLQKIQVPVWSKKDQSDLKWYDAEKVGTNQYRVLVDYANHQFNQGDYIAHLYTYEKSGKVTSVNLGTMQLTSAPLKVETTKAVNEKNGTAVITLKTNDDRQLQKIQVPVWSKKDQSDLKWYDAEKVGTNQYRVLVDYANHQFNQGDYIAHLYTYEKSGKVTSVNLGTMQLTSAPLKVETTKTVNEKNGTAVITLKTNDDRQLQKIQVPVWSKKDQSDLKWYDAEKVGTNQYRVLVDYANHQFNQGDYIAHLYTYEKSGRVTSTNIGPFFLKN